MQFAYQFPERIQRLVLISSGGLGPQLTPMLRAATLPGAATVASGASLSPALAASQVNTAKLTSALPAPIGSTPAQLAGSPALAPRFVPPAPRPTTQ